MALEQITFNIGAFNDSDAGGNNYFTNTVFEVKNQSDNTFATIYADSSGTTQIPQNGIDNVSNSRGECDFYIDDGDFYIEVNSQQKRFSTSKKASSISNDNGGSAQNFLNSIILSDPSLSSTLSSTQFDAKSINSSSLFQPTHLVKKDASEYPSDAKGSFGIIEDPSKTFNITPVLGYVSLTDFNHLIPSAAGAIDTWDWTEAVKAADEYAAKFGFGVQWPSGLVNIDGQVGIIKAQHRGVGMGYFRRNQSTSTLLQTNGTCVLVNHGYNSDHQDWLNAVFSMDSGSSFSNISFFYPLQTMASGTHTQCSPLFVSEVGALNFGFENVSFGNAYVAVDVRRDHGIMTIRNCRGYPLRYGLRIGSMIDNDYVDTLHWQPFFGETSLEGAKAVQLTGVGIELGRNSWSVFDKYFCYGYRFACYAEYQPEDAANGINRSGGTRRVTFKNVGIDSCYYPFFFNGTTGGLNEHYEINIQGNISAKEAYDNGQTNPVAVFFDFQNGYSHNAGELDIQLHEAHGRIAQLNNVRGLEIKGNYFQWAQVTSVAGVRMSGCTDVSIEASFDSQDSGRSAIELTNDNTGISIRSKFRDFTGSPVVILDDNNSYYSTEGSTFRRTSGAGTRCVFDAQNDSLSNIPAIPSNNNFLSNSDVDVDGILTIPSDMHYGNYTGTSDIKGVRYPRFDKTVKIRFSNSVTVFTNAAGISAENQITSNNPDISTAENMVITINSDGNGWFLN